MSEQYEARPRLALARRRRVGLPVLVMLAAGVTVMALVGVLHSWVVAPAAGWCSAALVYDLWVWAVIVPMDADRTRAHATVDDPSRGVREVLIVCANVGALIAVLAVIVAGAGASGLERKLLAGLALATVASSWLLLHTLFTLRYAALYFGRDPEGGIGFNQREAPAYTDIAYMAFSLGMTYQVSDNAIEDHQIRTTALVHSLLAYVFGTGILATTINLVVSLVQ